MQFCLYCDIISGKQDSFIILEDRQFLAILDKFPVVEGHVLVIPKKHYRWVHEVESFDEYWVFVKRVALAILKVLPVKTVVFSSSGRQVPHAHVHVMPQPDVKTGEFLPGVESAKRLTVTKEELQKTASGLWMNL